MIKINLIMHAVLAQIFKKGIRFYRKVNFLFIKLTLNYMTKKKNKIKK